MNRRGFLSATAVLSLQKIFKMRTEEIPRWLVYANSRVSSLETVGYLTFLLPESTHK